MSQIEGRRPVTEALRAGRDISEIYLLCAARGVDEIRKLAARRGVPVREVPREAIDRLARTRSPQGVIAVTEGFGYVPLASLVVERDEKTLLVALDHVTDPQNLGAIARSAEAAGAHGLVIPDRRAASVGPAVDKASAGALAHLPVARVPNLARALEEMKSAGLWIVALDTTGQRSVYDLALATESLCLVVGGEYRGVSKLIRERADQVVAIPMSGRVASLNASAAAAVALFEICRQRA